MTLLVSTRIYKIIRFTVEIAYFLQASPLRWDKNSNLYYFSEGYFNESTPKSVWAFRGWNLVKYIYFGYLVFLLYGFVRLAATGTVQYRPISTQTVGVVICALACLSQLVIMKLHTGLLNYMNQGLKFYRWIEGMEF